MNYVMYISDVTPLTCSSSHRSQSQARGKYVKQT